MIELGQNSAQTYVSEGSEATFMEDVVDASQSTPVIVDFWAPWCGPCKTLGPALEAAVNEMGGRVKMVKLDVDQNQQIATQLRVQSIPTVFAFWQGQPVDGFQGALPPSEVKAFVEKTANLGGEGADDGLAGAVDAAETMLAEGAAADAAETFAAILEEDPTNAPAYAGLARAYLALGQTEQAEAVLNGAPAELSTTPELEAVHAQLDLARQAEGAGPVTDLESKLKQDENDHQTRYDLAIALQAAGRSEEAVDHLLEIFRRDREWNDGAAKAQLFTFFDALGAQDPVAQAGRRKLSSMIFA